MGFDTYFKELCEKNMKIREKVLERLALKGPVSPGESHPDIGCEEKCWKCKQYLTPVIFRCPELKVMGASLLVGGVCKQCKAGKPHYGYVCKICSLKYTAEEVWHRRVKVFMSNNKPKRAKLVKS